MHYPAVLDANFAYSVLHLVKDITVKVSDYQRLATPSASSPQFSE